MEEGTFGDEGHTVHFYLFVFIFIHFFHAQPEHDPATSARAHTILAQTDTNLVVFLIEDRAKFFEYVAADSNFEHDVLRFCRRLNYAVSVQLALLSGDLNAHMHRTHLLGSWALMPSDAVSDTRLSEKNAMNHGFPDVSAAVPLAQHRRVRIIQRIRYA